VGFLISSVGQLAEKLEAYIEGRAEVEDLYQSQGKRGPESIGILSQDDEMKETVVDKWIAQKKLSRLLDLWVRGLNLDWSRLYGEVKPRRIELPVYPFAKERYWIDMPAATGGAIAVLHPLLHRNTSDLREQRYSSTFTGEEIFLTDHRVRRDDQTLQKVLPGVAYLEMARAAIEQASPSQPESGILELRNTVWLKPIVVTEPKQVSIALLVNDSDEIGYEIYSVEAEHKTEDRIVHCQGEAAFIVSSGPVRLDIERLKEQMNQGRFESSDIYAIFSRMGLHYGAGHRGIVAIDLGKDQLLAQLHLPVVGGAGRPEYVLHPGLMDSALQTSIGLIADLNHAPDKPVMPFVLESVRILSACTGEMLAWTRYSQGSGSEDKTVRLDIDLCDRQGIVCVQMRGLVSRVPDNAPKPAHPNTIDDLPSDDPNPAKGQSDFDGAFYQRLIAEIVNGEVSVDEAAEAG
jgi:acyl transferase domain-containing protein